MTGDAVWVGSPRSYTQGRARPVQYVTLHYTAGSEGPQSAENGAAYDKTRTDGTSTHYFTDSSGPPLQEVSDGDRSHAARYHGNEIGIHIEICGTKQTRAQWLDPVSMATLETTAKLVYDLCIKHGFPLKRLTVDETRAAYYNASGKRPKGINDHNACTKAYPEDDGDHTDVGSDFPWDVFMDMVEGHAMSADDIAKGAWRTDGQIRNKPFYWRTDSESHDPKPTGDDLNEFIMGETAITEAAVHARKAFEQSTDANDAAQEALAVGKANAEALARIEAALASGVEVSAIVAVDEASQQAIAEKTADEIRNDPERDGV